MNKDFEKLKKVIFSTEEQNIDGTIYISKEQIKCLMLEDKIEELQNRIDKAIEYMKSIENNYDQDIYLQFKEYQEYQDLLNILKGGYNE